MMISGHFDPFHDGHLDYLKQAAGYGNKILCVVASDWQVIKKKGKVNIPVSARVEIMELILCGLHLSHTVIDNYWDTQTTLIANALEYWRPDILLRGGDKTIEDMPTEEKEVCDRLGIKILHAQLRFNRHGSMMKVENGSVYPTAPEYTFPS